MLSRLFGRLSLTPTISAFSATSRLAYTHQRVAATSMMPSVEARRSSRRSISSATAKTAAALRQDSASEGDESSVSPPPAPKRKRAKPAAKAATVKRSADTPDADGSGNFSPSSSALSSPASSSHGGAGKSANGNANGTGGVVADEPELDSDGEPVRRAKNGRKLPKKKAKKEKVYVIPPVSEHRDFRTEYRPGDVVSQQDRANGFTGRLGFACLNTVLRTRDPPVFSSRTARLKTIDEKGLDFVKDLARQNARDIIPMLRWNAEHNIRFMRLSSEIFPFASHATQGYSPECASEELAEAGRVARELNHRVTMHPGQFVQLGSPNDTVVQASIRDLEVHAQVLDLMGMDQDSVMIIHGGGVYGDRAATLERMRTTIREKVPEFVRRRIVLENDEIMWAAEELLPVCEEFNIPMVFDFHHDMLRPSAKSPRELMPQLLALFSRRGIKPKFHLSHPRPGSRNLRERRAHADRCLSLPLDLPADADLMIEAKDKEQAVFELYRVYKLFDVPHAALRPPADDITSATSGRRKVLNGSGGGAAGEDGDDGGADGDGPPPKTRKPTQAELNLETVRRSIEHAKRIAAKKGREWTGPEFVDPDSVPRGPIKSTAEVLEIMEEEAGEIREELKRGTERSISEIRDEVEERVEGKDRPGMPKRLGNGGGKTTPRKRGRKASSPSSTVGSEAEEEEWGSEGEGEDMDGGDPNEREVPGEEEKVPYAPKTPPPKKRGGGAGRAAGKKVVVKLGGETVSGDEGEPPVIVAPSSAQNVERVL